MVLHHLFELWHLVFRGSGRKHSRIARQVRVQAVLIGQNRLGVAGRALSHSIWLAHHTLVGSFFLLSTAHPTMACNAALLAMD
jgi:hypothetical protein